MAALAESELPSAGRGAALAWRLASDDALVRAAARGHEAAFAVLFQRYHAPLVRYCRSILLDGHDAQDAAQNALTAALRALRSERTLPLRLRPWLYRIAHNEALRVARRRPPVAGLDEEAAALAAPDDREAREALRELLGDLRTLPERQRSALVLRELEGLSYPEVAGALDMTPDAARRAVFEARASLWAHREGRAAACADVRMRLSEGDGRTARSRALRAHVAGCEACAAFADEMRARRRALRALFPLPGILAVGSGGGWALAGLGGASVATKCAALCATAVVVGGSVAAIETHHELHGGGIVSATAGPTPRPAPTPAPRAATTTQTALVLPVRAAATPARVRPKVAAPAPRRAAARPRTVARHRPTTVAHVPVATRAPAPAAAPVTTTTTTVAATPAPAPPPAATTTQQASAPSPITAMQTQARQLVEAMAAATTTVMTTAQQQLQRLRDAIASRIASTRQLSDSTLTPPTP